MKVEVAVLGSPSLTVLIISRRKATLKNRGHELCESRGGRPGLPIPNSQYGLFGRKATLKNRAHKLCESRGTRRGLPAPNSPYGLCGRKATLEREKKKKGGTVCSEVRSCVKVEVAVLGSPSIIVLISLWT